MNDENPRDELLDYVCGEMEDSPKDAFEAALRGDGGLAAETGRLARAIDALTADELPAPSSRFNAKLRSKLRKEFRARRVAAMRWNPRYWGRVFAELGAAAAVIALLGVVLFSATQRNAVAWGDVLKAMDQVTQFSLTITDSRKDELEKVEKVEMTDLFYKEPGLWRARNSRYVQFRQHGIKKAFDVKTRRPVARDTEELIPAKLAKAVHMDNLLNGILETLFE
ncbi:MAG: hypothetical protein ACYSTL_08340, partial [Planctomycetota bacterium]